MTKCKKCSAEGDYIDPESDDSLCSYHWAEWFASPSNEIAMSPEEEEECLKEVMDNVKNMTFVHLKRDMPSVDGGYTIAENTPGYVAEEKPDGSFLLEFSLVDGEEFIFPQCLAASDDFSLDEEAMNRVKKAFRLNESK